MLRIETTETEYLRQTTYGDGPEIDAAIIVSHGHPTVGDLFHKHPQLRQAYPADDAALEKAGLIDSDTFTPEIAHQTARLWSILSGIKVAVYEILFNRLILDPNRRRNHSIRREALDPSMLSYVEPILFSIYDPTIEVMTRILSRVRGVIIDLHSMMSTQVRGLHDRSKLDWSSEDFQHWIDLHDNHLDPNHILYHRAHDIISKYSNSTPLSHPELVKIFFEIFDSLGQKAEEDKPYCYMPQLQSTIYFEKNGSPSPRARKYISIDVLKHAFSKIALTDPRYRLNDLQADEDKISKFSQTTATHLHDNKAKLFPYKTTNGTLYIFNQT